MTLNIDIYPTLLNLARLPIPKSTQGITLVPPLTGRSNKTRSEWLYKHLFGQPTIAKSEGPSRGKIMKPSGLSSDIRKSVIGNLVTIRVALRRTLRSGRLRWQAGARALAGVIVIRKGEPWGAPGRVQRHLPRSGPRPVPPNAFSTDGRRRGFAELHGVKARIGALAG